MNERFVSIPKGTRCMVDKGGKITFDITSRAIRCKLTVAVPTQQGFMFYGEDAASAREFLGITTEHRKSPLEVKTLGCWGDHYERKWVEIANVTEVETKKVS